MKRIILLLLLSFFATQSYSQGLYGFEAGLGKATLKKSKITPAFEGYYLKRFTRSIYVGVSLFFERFSFTYYNDKLTPGNVNYGDLLSFNKKCSYLFLTPKFDLGIGYRKYWHASFAFGPGLLLGGQQHSNRFEPFWTSPGAYGRDTVTFYTNYNIPLTQLQCRLGVSRRISTLAYWNIMFSLDYTYMPRHISVGPPDLRTDAVCFTVGIMHKYPQVFVEY